MESNSEIMLYGIPNCDTVKKARLFLENHQIKYRFYNYKLEKVTADLLKQWIDIFGIDIILNRKSATYRQLSAQQKMHISPNVDSAQCLEISIQIMINQPTIIKRPILLGTFKHKKIVLIGFDEIAYAANFLS